MASRATERHLCQKKMKRHGNLFHKIVDLDNLHDAYRNARKGKSWQDTVKMFDANLDSNLDRIRESLLSKEYTTAAYRSKIVQEPKRRRIYILPFDPDRIVQHAIIQVLGPIWDKLFIYHSYSSRVGKGMHKASRKTMEYLRRQRYVLKADISKFYPSIDHDILCGIIKNKIKCKDTLWLLRDIVYSFDGDKNVPIGNYTSQWFGNLYLNELDQWVKNKQYGRYYIRYCDDFILFSNDKKHLHMIKDRMKEFLDQKLKLRFSRWSIFPVSQGIDYLGYRHFPGHVLLRKTTAKRVKKRIKRLPKMLASGQISTEQYRSSIASTTGWMKWANTHNLSLSLEIDKLEEMYEKV